MTQPANPTRSVLKANISHLWRKEIATRGEALITDDGTQVLELAELTLQLVESAIGAGTVLNNTPPGAPPAGVVIRLDGPVQVTEATAKAFLRWHADVGSLDVAATVVGRDL